MSEFSTPLPDPALRRLDRLVGTWEIRGRTLDSDVDDIIGRVTITWIAGGFYLEQRGTMDAPGFTVESLEIIGYDPSSGTFPSTVYSNVDGGPARYGWDVRGDIVTHWTKGSKYTGTFSKDGKTLSGSWRPDEGVAEDAGNTYDAVMIRMD